MTPLTQTILADPNRDDGHDAKGKPGDCLRTAVASLLDLDPATVPHFAESEDWWEAMCAWATERGGGWVYLPIPIPDDWQSWWAYARDTNSHIIMSGGSPRGSFRHVVIGNTNLDLVHDPHPSRDGLAYVDGIFIYEKVVKKISAVSIEKATV